MHQSNHHTNIVMESAQRNGQRGLPGGGEVLALPCEGQWSYLDEKEREKDVT